MLLPQRGESSDKIKMEMIIENNKGTLENILTKSKKFLPRAIHVAGGFALGYIIGMSREGEFNHTNNLLLTGYIPLIVFPAIDKLFGECSFKDSFKKAAYVAPAFLAGQYAGQFFKRMIQ